MKSLFLAFFAVVMLTFVASCSTPVYENPHYKKHKGGLFKFLYTRATAPSWGEGKASDIPFQWVDEALLKSPEKHMQVTWLGHACVLIQYQGINILTDPVFSDYAGPYTYLGPKRYTPLPFKEGQLPPIDYIVISHNHYDHLDVPTVKTYANKVQWIVPMGLKTWFENLGVHRVEERNWWESYEDKQVRFTCAPAQHWSKRTLFDTKKTLWASWAIQIGDKAFYFGGDTGYNPYQFKEIGERLGPFDAAAIPIGSYLPRDFMRPYHIDPYEAVTIHQEVRSHLSIGIHWGTFVLSQEALTQPPQLLKKASEKFKIKYPFKAIAIGKTLQLPSIH